jgi:hypothetical protein
MMLDWVYSRQRQHGLNPLTFEYWGPSEEEKTWAGILVNPEIAIIGQFLFERHISDWWWIDAAADRMVYRFWINFKNDNDYMLFRLAYSGIVIAERTNTYSGSRIT